MDHHLAMVRCTRRKRVMVGLEAGVGWLATGEFDEVKMR